MTKSTNPQTVIKMNKEVANMHVHKFGKNFPKIATLFNGLLWMIHLIYLKPHHHSPAYKITSKRMRSVYSVRDFKMLESFMINPVRHIQFTDAIHIQDVSFNKGEVDMYFYMEIEEMGSLVNRMYNCKIDYDIYLSALSLRTGEAIEMEYIEDFTFVHYQGNKYDIHDCITDLFDVDTKDHSDNKKVIEALIINEMLGEIDLITLDSTEIIKA